MTTRPEYVDAHWELAAERFAARDAFRARAHAVLAESPDAATFAAWLRDLREAHPPLGTAGNPWVLHGREYAAWLAGDPDLRAVFGAHVVEAPRVPVGDAFPARLVVS